MKRSLKLLLFLFALLVPAFCFLYSSGLFYQLFYAGSHPSFFTREEILNGIKDYGFDYVNREVILSTAFIQNSVLVYHYIALAILFIFAWDIKKRNLSKDSAVAWFGSMFFFSGIGMLFYFFIFIWNENEKYTEKIQLKYSPFNFRTNYLVASEIY